MPSISVIVPVYQAEKYVKKCVESVTKQTFSDWELLLVDDGCTDGSPAICDACAAEDDRIRVFHRKKNTGVSEARNLGLREAKGDYIAFLDVDDRFEFRALETLWSLREQSGADTVGCAHLNLTADGKKFAEKLLPAGVYDQQGIRENIVYDKKGVTDEQVQAACKAVGLDHFIRTLPQGYDTQLNDRVNLSAGQKQLVTIARAMIENAPLLILDEATSSVDTRTEALVQAAMDKLTENRTSFVIAHRLSTIRNADLILVLKDGDVVESGTHQELLDKGGFYASLYNSQFEGTVA